MTKMGDFDYSQLEKLAQNVKKAVSNDVFDNFIKDFLLEMAYRADQKIKMRTPVDTGDLRRRWVVGEVQKVEGAYVVEISNNLDYASFVEYGHRAGKDRTGWVEGRFMATISIKEIEREFPKYLEQRFMQMLEKINDGRG